jgi:hypothetical protein
MTMNSRERRQYERETNVSPELKYLVEDVEKLVNERAEEYLDGTPFRVKVEGFSPDLITGQTPLGIRRIKNTYMKDVGSPYRELRSVDFSFQFPLNPESDNPIAVGLDWTDDKVTRLSIINSLPLLLVDDTKSGKTLRSLVLERSEMASVLNTIGLPDSIWGISNRELLEDLHSAKNVLMTRKISTPVDPFSSLEIVHDARIADDIDGNRQVVQELCLNIDHLDVSPQAEDDTLYLPPQDRFRNALRFERTEDESKWKFVGAYHGKLGTGTMLYEKVHLEPRLGIPSGKVINKALSVLSQRPY